MPRLKASAQLLRVSHWIKNILVFVPLFFNMNLFKGAALASTVRGFVCFCLLSSIVYIQNDLRDIDKDRRHSSKRRRPLASGAIPPRGAFVLLFLLAAALAGIFALGARESPLYGLKAAGLLALYAALNTGYSWGLKNIPIVDVTILAAGYVIRVLFGAVIIGAEVSVWLYLVITMGAYYLGLGKRRNELGDGETETRAVMRFYSHNFLDKNMYVSQALCLVFYALWSIDPATVKRLNTSSFAYTIPLVFLILLKYSLNVESGSDGDPAPVLIHDRALVALCMVYLLSAFCIIYLNRGIQ
jgi:4-hydroxybenzoate polyprenyltransferase